MYSQLVFHLSLELVSNVLDTHVSLSKLYMAYAKLFTVFDWKLNVLKAIDAFQLNFNKKALKKRKRSYWF